MTCGMCGIARIVYMIGNIDIHIDMDIHAYCQTSSICGVWWVCTYTRLLNINFKVPNFKKQTQIQQLYTYIYTTHIYAHDNDVDTVASG